MAWPITAMPVLLFAIILICGVTTGQAGVAALTKRSAQSSEESEQFDFNPLIELLRGQNGQDGKEGRDGRDGMPGPPGPPGPPSNGGVVYTRWGRKTCPDTGTELVYAGRAGGTYYTTQGGAANHLCLPEDPDYLQFQAGVQGHSPVWGAEYETGGATPLGTVHDHNVPCAVCYTSARITALLIPAKTRCPSSWTHEYTGYLMTERATHRRSMFECIDKDPDSVPGSATNVNGALFYHTEATCTGLPCPPYDANKELTCVMCTK